MTDSQDATARREMVAVFTDRETFQAAAKALTDAGFDRADLSVLSSHDSIDAVGRPARPWQDVLTALIGETKFEVPLVASGAVFLVGGPVAGTIAALVAATVGGMAVKDVLDEVTAVPDSEDFARAVEAGSVILWVTVGDDHAKEILARDVMTRMGGTNVHLHGD